MDHQECWAISTDLSPAGMLRDESVKSIRTPALLASDAGYHVLELPPEWEYLLSEFRNANVNVSVLLQFAQHKVSYRTERVSERASYRAPPEVCPDDVPF
jgi:hypothetical protein